MPLTPPPGATRQLHRGKRRRVEGDDETLGDGLDVNNRPGERVVAAKEEQMRGLP